MTKRRNQITRSDATVVGVIAVVTGVVAALAGCEPTGNAIPDAILTFALGAMVAWLGASSPWWALLTGAAVTALVGAGGPIVLVVTAWVAMAAAVFIGAYRYNKPILRSVVAGAVVQVALRLEFDPFFLASAIAAAIALGVIAVAGLQRRRGFVRKRVIWTTVGLVGFAALASVAFGVSGLRVRQPATDGYRAMLLALELIESGDLPGASAALTDAAEGLGTAGDALSSPLTQPARVVPGVAQNRDISAGVLGRAGDAAAAAGDALNTVDLDRLRIVDGVVDILALEALEAPLAELKSTVLELQDALEDARSPWLVGPLESRLDAARTRADQVAVQAVASHAAAQVAPDLLGANEPRRYFIAFTNPAESRGQSGLMGNWSEMTITNGRIEVTQSGRTAMLERALTEAGRLPLDMPDDYLTHYEFYGSGGLDGTPSRKWWVNAFLTPDTPSVGKVLAQMYERATDRRVDGVIVMDPVAIAGLLAVTGPIEVPSIDQQLSSSNAVEFLTLGQYEFAENEREDFLTAVTSLTVEALLESSLPPPQELGARLGPAATEGHLSAWAADPDEQRLLELVGMDAAMPVLDDVPTTDALAVTFNNGGGSKIDSFLERDIVYRPRVDESTGAVIADLQITMTNTAPTSGYEDYVIGNILDLPSGMNRAVVEIWSALEIQSLEIDGEVVPWAEVDDLGWNITALIWPIPSGESITVDVELAGYIEPGEYELVYRPQPLPRPDTLTIDARDGSDNELVQYEGTPLRRTLITRTSADAWRPDGHPARR